jgi:hypothetical protein
MNKGSVEMAKSVKASISMQRDAKIQYCVIILS